MTLSSHRTADPITARPDKLDRRFCVAPMMDWTDRHCRYFHRLLSQHAVLYTEMVTTGALIHGEAARFLPFNAEEHPVALQLGGSDPAQLAHCAQLAQQWGYDEVNLNVGCPSDRVQNNMIGACLMAHPQRVADCLAAMRREVDIPVTVKHRIGIDEMDSYEQLARFVDTVATSGCKTFIVHARKAILQGLSPKENREIPPLRYEVVYRLKEAFPELEIIINGGIKSLAEAHQHLAQVDGVMVGREAYQNPMLLAAVDTELYGADRPAPAPHAVIERFIDYVERQLAQGVYLNHMARHILGLFQGRPGARKFRRHLSEQAHKPGADAQVLRDALALVPR